MQTKAEKREKLRLNHRKMIVSGRGIFNLLRLRNDRIIHKKALTQD